MPILDAAHDFAHPVEGDTAWSESYYFNAYDPGDRRRALHAHRRPPERGHDGRRPVGVAAGQRHRHVLGVRDAERDDRRRPRRRRRPLRAHRADARQWRLTADADARRARPRRAGGPRGTTPPRARPHASTRSRRPIGSDGQGRAGAGRQRRDAQAASARATSSRPAAGRAGSRPTACATSSARRAATATSRGARGAGAARRCGAGSRSTSATTCTSAASASAPTPATCTAAGCGATASTRASASGRSRSELAADGVTHRATHVRATDKRGRVHELHADVLRVAAGAHEIGDRRTIVNEGLARWTYEGRDRLRHQRVPAPARRRRPAAGADRVSAMREIASGLQFPEGPDRHARRQRAPRRDPARHALARRARRHASTSSPRPAAGRTAPRSVPTARLRLQQRRLRVARPRRPRRAGQPGRRTTAAAASSAST